MLAVSVVIPAYNARNFLPVTLSSVLAQRGVMFEVIVVDDGSTDGTAEAVEAAFPQVRVLRQANAGVAAARNAGVRAAIHPWVAFLDADDVWLPGKLAAQARLLQCNPEARMGYTAWEVWRAEAVEPPAALLRQLQQECEQLDEPSWRHGPSGWIYPELLTDCVVWTSTVMAERRLLLELGGFDESRSIGEDYDLWLRASRCTPVVRLNRPFAVYRIHASNTTGRAPSRNHQAEVVGAAIAQWGYQGPDGRQANRSMVCKGLAQSWRGYGAMCLREGRRADAQAALTQALRLDPWSLSNWRLAVRMGIERLIKRYDNRI